MDFTGERKAILNLQGKMFNMCERLITDAEAGEGKLTGSMLKEVNHFLQVYRDALTEAESAPASYGEMEKLDPLTQQILDELEEEKQQKDNQTNTNPLNEPLKLD